MKKKRRHFVIEYYIIAIIAILLLMGDLCGDGNGGNGYTPEPEEFNTMSTEYRYMYDDFSGKRYDCFEWGSDALYDAFIDANIKTEIIFGNTIYPDSYPETWAQMSTLMLNHYSQADSTPWYLEGGICPISNAQWATDSTFGIASPGNPYWSFAVVFVGRAKTRIKQNIGVAVKMVTIHELGHEYGHLTDKYLHEDQHSPDICCVMDILYIYADSSVKECKHFCPMCIDSLKKVEWSY